MAQPKQPKKNDSPFEEWVLVSIAFIWYFRTPLIILGFGVFAVGASLLTLDGGFWETLNGVMVVFVPFVVVFFATGFVVNRLGG